MTCAPGGGEVCGVFDEQGLPVHMPLNLDLNWNGPASDEGTHRIVCWCGEKRCPWTVALEASRRLGMRQASSENTCVACGHPVEVEWTASAEWVQSHLCGECLWGASAH